jgi:hypothetical protein
MSMSSAAVSRTMYPSTRKVLHQNKSRKSVDKGPLSANDGKLKQSFDHIALGFPENVRTAMWRYVWKLYKFQLFKNTPFAILADFQLMKAGEELEKIVPSTFLLPVVGALESLVESNVPSPRLVGIELNPGPRLPKSDATAAIAALGAAVGSAIAKTQKKKTSVTKKKKSSRKAPSLLNDLGGPISRLSAPAATGFRIQSQATSHSPFVVKGKGLAGLVKSNGTGATAATNRGGAGALSAFNIDPCGSGSTQTNWLLFPLTINRISSNFTRYRLKKFLLSYVPYCPTTTAGSVVIGAMAEVVSSTYITSFDSAATLPNSSQTNVWGFATVDCMRPGGLRSEWLFLDSSASAGEANQRQECPGAILVSLIGNGVNGDYGCLHIDYEIEFDGLAMQDLFNQSTSIGGSSVPIDPRTQITEVPSPTAAEALSDSVYLPSTLLNGLGLQRRQP